MCRPKSARSSPKGEHGAPKGLEFARQAVEFDLADLENIDVQRKTEARPGFNIRFSAACELSSGELERHTDVGRVFPNETAS